MVQSAVSSQATINSLPLEVVIMIMERLPVKDALNLGTVLQLPQQVAVQYFVCDREVILSSFYSFFKHLKPSSYKFLLKNKSFQIKADLYQKTRAALRTFDLDFVMKYLEKVQPDLNFALRAAIECGFTDAVNLLLSLSDARVDPSAQSNKALILAAQNGYLEIVKLLLSDTRVDPSPQSNYALRCASENGHLEIVKHLLLDDQVYPSADIIDYIRGLDYVKGDLEMEKVFRSYRNKKRSKLKEKLYQTS